MFFSEKLRRIIGVFLMITILIPSIFFSVPKKTEAIIGIGDTVYDAAGYFITAVDWMANAASEAYNSVSAMVDEEILMKEFIFDPLAWGVKEILIRQIVADTVGWINNGFEGNPAFVTDLNGLLESTTDAVIGEWILGSKLDFLCSPFSLQVRLTLLQQFTGTVEPRCTLSEVTENIDNAISDLSNQWDWNTWNSITQNSNNNAYGTYIEVSQMINDDITREADNLVKKLGWGDGFLSYEKCTDYYSEGVDGGTTEQYCEIVTPGSVIASTLNEHLKIQGRELVEADEINEIVGALFGQLMKKIMGPEGLASVSNNDLSDQKEIDLLNIKNQITKSIDTSIDRESEYINIKSDSLDALEEAKNKLEILIDCYNTSTSTNEYLIESAYSIIDNKIQPKIDKLTRQVNISYSNIEKLDSIKSNILYSDDITTINYFINLYEDLKASGDLTTVKDIVDAKAERDGGVNPGIIESMNLINASTDQKLLICQSGSMF